MIGVFCIPTSVQAPGQICLVIYWWSWLNQHRFMSRIILDHTGSHGYNPFQTFILLDPTQTRVWVQLKPALKYVFKRNTNSSTAIPLSDHTVALLLYEAKKIMDGLRFRLNVYSTWFNISVYLFIIRIFKS